MTEQARDPVAEALKRTAHSVRHDAASITLEKVMQRRAPSKTKSASPVGSRVARIGWATLVLALVAGGLTSLVVSSSSPHPDILKSLGQLEVIAPGGFGGPSFESISRHIDLIDPATGAVQHLGEAPGVIKYPWVVDGDKVVMIAGLTGVMHYQPPDGYALAFSLGQSPPEKNLGLASNLVASKTRDAVWIETAPTVKAGGLIGGSQGDVCTIHEVSISGRALTPNYLMDCDRWLIAAVDGGLLTAPNLPGSSGQIWNPTREIWPTRAVDLQVWNPASDRVVRNLASGVRYVQAVSSQYVEWETAIEWGNPREWFWQHQSSTVELTNVKTGETRPFTAQAPEGTVVAGTPALAPQGPLIAFTAVSPRDLKRIDIQPIQVAEGILLVRSGYGRLVVKNFKTAGQVLNRSATVSNLSFTWSPDDNFLVVTSAVNRLTFVPEWSNTAPTKTISLPVYPDAPGGSYADAEVFAIAVR